MANALYSLQRDVSNIGHGGTELHADRWVYNWKDMDGTRKETWWCQSDTSLIPFVYHDIKHKDIVKDDVIEKTFVVNGTEVFKFFKVHRNDRYNWITQIGNQAGRGNLGTLRRNIKEGLRTWYGIGDATHQDAADFIRWMLRNPRGPFVRRAFLCWPETILHVMDHLDVHQTTMSSSGFVHALNGLRVRDTLGFDGFEAARNNWIGNDVDPERATFLDCLIDWLRQDYGSEDGFDRGIEAFLRSLYCIAYTACELRAAQGGRRPPVQAICMPDVYNEPPELEDSWPQSFEASRRIINPPDERYAAIDLLAACYYVSIFGPQDVTYLFAHRRAPVTEAPEHYNPDRVPRDEQLTYCSPRVFESCERAWPPSLRLTDTAALYHGLQAEAHAGQHMVLLRIGQDEIVPSCVSPIIVRKDSLHREAYVSRRHFEICYVQGAWRLFDRGVDGRGSSNATLVQRENESLVLSGTSWKASAESSFEVIPFDDAWSPLDRIPLRLGVTLREGDLISVCPRDHMDREPFGENFDFTQVHSLGKERFEVAFAPLELVPGVPAN